MRKIKRNPLGTRKLDVQKDRRMMRSAARDEAHKLSAFKSEMFPMNQEQVVHLLKIAYADGWEAGVTVGSQAQLGRIREALERGTLLMGGEAN